MPTQWPRRFASEGATVGRLPTGYVKLEIDLMNCVPEVRFRERSRPTLLKVSFSGFVRSRHYMRLSR